MTIATRLLITTALAGVMFLPGLAAAQDVAAATQDAEPAAASTPSATGDIVVTAQRREQSLQRTPIAITAFTPEMLQTRGINDVTNIAASTPGLYLTQGTASPSTIEISMRGALEQNGGSITSESPVAIYIDDVYQSRLSAANYDLADIERVEVLRGPQGTLYGRNSMTGAIKLITRQPDGRTWLNGDVSYASFNEDKIKLSAGAPLGEHLAFAASGFYDDRAEGWQYNETLQKDVGKFEHYGGQLSLGITNVSGLEAVLSGRYVVSNSDGQHFLPINEATYQPAIPFYDTRTPRDALGDNTQSAVSLRLGYDIGNITLRSITAYQHIKDAWNLDFSGGYIQPNGAIDVGFYRQSVGSQSQFTQEFQLLGKGLNNRLNYIFGAYFFDETANQTVVDDLGAFFLNYLPESFDTHSKSLAFYGQADYEIVSGLTATVGIRYTSDRKRFNGLTQNGAIEQLVAVADRVDANVWTPKFNLQYNLTPHAMVYGTVSKGYRAAGFNSLVIADPADFGSPYKPEFSWSYEVGTKFDAFDRKLRLNVSAYWEDLSNLQTLADAGGGSYIIQNAAQAKVQGIESEITLNPVKNLSLFGNLTYTYDKYGKLNPLSEAAQTGATRLPLISRWQYQIGGTYELPLGAGGSVVLASDYSFRSHYYSLVSLAESSDNPGIGRANASITYKSPHDRYEIYGQATNVTNSKDYYGSAEFIPGVFGYKIPLEPRILRIGFRYKM